MSFHPVGPANLTPPQIPPTQISLSDPKFPKEFPETFDPPDHQISKGISGNLYQGQVAASGTASGADSGSAASPEREDERQRPGFHKWDLSTAGCARTHEMWMRVARA